MSHHTYIRVRGHHLDLYQHVNNARYLEFLEEARWHHFECCGDMSAILACQQALIVVNININYRHAAHMNDLLDIETRFMDIKRRNILMQQIIRMEGAQTVVADATISFIVYDKTKNKAVPLEGELKTLLMNIQSATENTP